MKRVLFQPVAYVTLDNIDELTAAGEDPRLREQYKVLVPVQLPYVFVIARARAIKIRYAAEVMGGRFNAVNVVTPPPNGETCFNLDTQQWNSVFNNAVRKPLDFGSVRSSL